MEGVAVSSLAEGGLIPKRDRHICREMQTPDGACSVGMNDDGTIDEVLVHDAAGNIVLHIEQMDDDCYWMNAGGQHFHFRYEPRKRVTLRASWFDAPDALVAS